MLLNPSPLDRLLAFKVPLDDAICSEHRHRRLRRPAGSRRCSRNHTPVTNEQIVDIVRLEMRVDHRSFGVDSCSAGTHFVGPTAFGSKVHGNVRWSDLPGPHLQQDTAGHLQSFFDSLNCQAVISTIKEFAVCIDVPASGGFGQGGRDRSTP